MLSNANPKVKPGQQTRAEARTERNRAAALQWLNVCKGVDLRDGGRCRVCRRKCSTTALAMTVRAERHHLALRSRGGGNTTSNVLTVCRLCHGFIHTCGTLQLSGDADLRNDAGKLCGVLVERPAGAGWRVEKHC